MAGDPHHDEGPPPGPGPGPKTAENLGGSPVLSHLTYDGVPNCATGYSLVTDGRAYWEAEKQHYVCSDGGDVIFHADTHGPVVLQSDLGSVEINAGDTTTFRSHKSIHIFAGELEPQTPDYFHDFANPEHHKAISYYQQKYHSWADQASYGLEVALLAIRNLKEPHPHHPGPRRGHVQKGLMGLAAANLRNAHWHPHYEDVTFEAKGEFSGGAGVTASLYGLAAAEVIASMGALLLGTAATVKGLVFGGVLGGVEACLNALKTVKVAAADKVEVQSAKSTSLIGQVDVRMHGGHLSQLDGEHATVSGFTTFVGAGSSWGLTGDSNGMMIRQVGNAKKFNAPAGKFPEAGIKKKNIHFAAQEGTELRMKPMESTMEAAGKYLKLNGMGIEGHAPKVELET